MKENPLIKLTGLGQSIWLDFISRQLIASGELQRLIEEDGLRGVTSNPSIFEKAISGSHDYDDAIRALAREGKSLQEIYEALTVADVQRAADVFRPLYDRLEGADGFVSLEVNPHLAHDTDGTIAEARRLWGKLNRPNVFIKVPATLEGLPAIRQLISEGINVNVTLLFGLPRYREVAEAYLAGLEDAGRPGPAPGPVASVASFFLSRIDVLVDPQLEKHGQSRQPHGQGRRRPHAERWPLPAPRWLTPSTRKSSAATASRPWPPKGARAQRLLWASTSTKNPAYPDVKYVEPLIGPETINTLPVETLNAYRDHGQPAVTLPEGLEKAAAVLQRLPELGIDLNRVTQQLEDEGVEKFNQPYDNLMRTLEGKRR